MTMRNKYGNKKVCYDGIVFDSHHECKRYVELKLLQAAGMISDLKCQVEFELIPAQYETVRRYSNTGKRLKDGKKCLEKAVKYIADFTYTDKDGTFVCEDAKGKRTKEYIIKRKLMLYIKNIQIREV